MKSGIYKITSPSGKIYIGESGDIKTRFRYYNNLQCKNQPRLYNSFLKYNVENHIFEILEECDNIDLLTMERFYQLKFNSIGKNGLNCKLTEIGNKKYSHSQETKDKIGLASSKRSHTNETKAKIAAALKGRKWPEQQKINFSVQKTGKPMSKGTCLKISKTLTGIKRSQIFKDKLSKILTGRKLSEEWKNSIQSSSKKKVVIQLDLNNNTICRWNSVREACRETNIDNGSISKCCNGLIKTAGKYKWKYE